MILEEGCARFLHIDDSPVLHVIGSVISGVVAQTVIMPVGQLRPVSW